MLLQQKEALITLIASLVFLLVRIFVLTGLGEIGSETTLFLLAFYIVTLWTGRILIGARFRKLDERDKAIRYQAAMLATHVFGLTVIGFVGALYVQHRDGLIVPLSQVINLAFYSWISLYLSWSAAMLVLHRTGTINV